MTPNREQLTAELKIIEGSYEREITPEKQRRAQEIIKILSEGICRHCSKVYNVWKSRADLQGFCSAKCQHAKAKACGFRKGGKSEYQVLKYRKCIGSDFVCK